VFQAALFHITAAGVAIVVCAAVVAKIVVFFARVNHHVPGGNTPVRGAPAATRTKRKGKSEKFKLDIYIKRHLM